tara:strand:+ start:3323 stop:4249 length:927 start_codon:yes stop_codon:yes gene_type:complete
MKNLKHIDVDSLDILKTNSFIHNEFIFIPSINDYIKGKTLTINNVKSIAKMFMLDSGNLDTTLLHYFTDGQISLNYLTNVDKLSILTQIVVKNSFDPLELCKDCSNCGSQLKTVFDEEKADFESWKVPRKIVKAEQNGQQFEFELGLPSVIDLKTNEDITIISSPLSYVKKISINGETIDNLEPDTKTEMFSYLSHTILNPVDLIEILKENIDIKIPHRCYECSTVNNFEINDTFLWQEIISKFFVGSFQQVIEDEIFITRNSSTQINNLGDLSYMDFSLYVNKLESSIIKEVEYKRKQLDSGKYTIS